MNKEILDKYDILVNKLIENELSISTMESCTGGQIASYITDIEGSSNVIKGAIVAYSNEAKIRNGVDSEIIEKHGVYSFDAAEEMAKACIRMYGSDIGIGVTGTFSNIDENNADSIVNNVFVSIIYKEECYRIGIQIKEEIRYKAKDEVALETVNKILELI